MSSPLSIRKGTSRCSDPAQAARELYAALQQPNIKLAVFYCSPYFDLPALARELQQCFATIPLIGCTTEGYLNGALTGFSLASDGLDVASACINLTEFNAEHTAAQVDRLLLQLGKRNGLPASATDTFAFLLNDGLRMQEEDLVSCVYRSLNGIELAGGSAGDDTRFAATHVYFEGAFQQHIALLTIVRSDQPFTVFRTQHFLPSERRMVVTKAVPAQRLVQEINGLPAAQEFARLVGVDPAQLTPLVFATHPLVIRIGGQYFLRSIARVNADASLTFLCAIEPGMVLTIAQGIDMVANLQAAFAQVHADIGPPELVLGYDCILRRLESERSNIKQQVADIMLANNVIGFATYGEQFNAMHVNQTFTGIALGRRP